MNRLGLWLFTVIFFGSMIPFTLFLAYQYKTLSDTWVNDIKTGLSNASQALKSDLGTLISGKFDMLSHLANTSDVVAWLQEGDTSHPDEPLMNRLGLEAGVFGFENLFITDASGRLILAWPDDGSIQENQALFGPYGLQDWARVSVKILKSEGRFCSPPLGKGVGNPKVFAYISLAIVDQAGNTLGSATGGLRKTLFQGLVNRPLHTTLSPIQQSVLNDDFNTIMGSYDSDGLSKVPVDDPGMFSDMTQNWGPGSLLFHDRVGNRYVGMRDRLDTALTRKNPWFIQTITSLTPYYSKKLAFRSSAVRFGLCALGLTILIAWYLSHGTTRVIRHYLAWSQNLLDGNISELPRPKGNNEIAELGKALSDVSLRLKDLVRFCSNATVGDFGKPFAVRDENDELGKGINGIRDYFRSIKLKIKSISEGKYTVDRTQETENDELLPLINKLSEALNRMNEDNMRQITVSLAQVELARKISENRELSPLIEQVLSFFCQYFKSRIGVFYVLDRETTGFVRAGIYGAMENDFPDRIQPGNGLCGQAIIEKMPLVAQPEHAESRELTTGLGRMPSDGLMAYPFLLGDEVIGVMELGCLGEFKSEYTDFVRHNNDSIAIGINSAQNRALTETLLKTTLEQADRLKVNQDKLSRVNKKLAEQTWALKKSETRLMAREKELENANEALEVRSSQLEEQKNSLDLKNKELIETKSILEIKAEELTLSNRYKSEFLANMSHELRTPLNSIILLSKLLADKLDGQSESQHSKFASIINTSGKELMNLIDEVLDLTRVTSGSMDVKLISYELPDIAGVMNHWQEKHINKPSVSFETRMVPGLPDHIVTDPQKLERILKSIVSNAFKYTDQGSVLMEIKRPSPETALPDKGLTHESTVEFSIQDTGQGIPPDMQALVFDAFKQVDGSITRKHGGTGLGLSLAQEFARLLGGEIVLMHSDARGSVFSLFLPDAYASKNRA